MAVNLFGSGAGNRRPGLDISNLGNDLTRFLTDVGGMGLLPGRLGEAIRDFQQTPFFQRQQRGQLGREQSAALTEALPDLSRFSATDDVTSLTLPSGERQDVSLPEIGTRRVSERFAEFDALTQMAAEQRAEIADFRVGLNDVQAGLKTADRLLAQAGISSLTQLRRGLQDNARLRQETLMFMAAGLRRSDENIREIQAGNETVLANIDVDIAGRLASTREGIEASSNALFNQVSRDLDSQSPMSPEERAGLRMAFNAQAATDNALALGGIHAAAVEYRGKVAADLQVSQNTARSFAIQSSSVLIAQGISAFTQANTVSADLRKAHMNDVKQLNIARSELAQFSATFTDAARRTLFEMVTLVERPVLVFSDIMYDMFDDAFAIAAFNNSVAQLTFVNKAAAISPEYAAEMAAIGAFEQRIVAGEERDFQRGQASQARTTQLATAGLGGLAEIGAARAGRP